MVNGEYFKEPWNEIHSRTEERTKPRNNHVHRGGMRKHQGEKEIMTER